MAKAVAHFTVTRTGDEYLLSIEDEDGDTTDFTAGPDELELIADAIEEAQASDDDDTLGLDEDEDEERAEE
jgi:hypothetical protein